MATSIRFTIYWENLFTIAYYDAITIVTYGAQTFENIMNYVLRTMNCELMCAEKSDDQNKNLLWAKDINVSSVKVH